MAEKSIEEKSRKIASQRPEAGKEFEQMQAAQNQLLEIQAAQKQNLMEQRVMSNSQAEQNQILAQAANVGAQSVAGNMQLNQATQQTMGRYGLSQPRTSSQTKQRHSEVVTRQNVTIHNNTTNITNNTVPANIGGPLQGRPLQFQQAPSPAQTDGGMGKFKNWLNQTFARQDEAAKKRDREYQRRETALTKSSNKMMRKIEEFSKDITKKLDPRNVGRTIGGQLRTILRLIGLGVIAKNFTSILDWILGAQKKVETEYIPNIKNFFAWIRGDKDAKEPGLITKITGAFENTSRKLLFGKDSNQNVSDKGLLRGIRDYLWNETTNEDERGVLNKAWDKLKDIFQERSRKAKEAITLSQSATWSNIFDNPIEAIKELFTNITNYFGVIFGGDAYLGKIQENLVTKKAGVQARANERTESKHYKDAVNVRAENGNKYFALSGDADLLKFKQGQYRNTTQYNISQQYMDSNGNLKTDSIGAALNVSNNIMYHRYGAHNHGQINTATLANDFSYLYSEAGKRPLLVNENILSFAKEKDPNIVEKLKEGGHITDARDGDWILVLRKREISDIEEDLQKATPKWRRVSDYLRGHNWDGLATIYELAAGANFLETFPEEVKSWFKKIPLYTQEIIRKEDLREEDILIERLSAKKLKSLGYAILDQEAIRQAAYGFISNEDRKNMKAEDLSFSKKDKTGFVLPLQHGLEEEALKTRNKTDLYYDYDANGMMDYDFYNYDRDKQKSNSTKTSAPSSSTQPGTHTRPTGANTSSENTSEDSGEQPNSGVQMTEGNQQTMSGRLIYGPSGPFDPIAASEWITTNASPDCLGGDGGSNKGITGWCGRWVRQALVNGGMYGPGLTESGGPNGGDFKPVLERLGWKEISKKGPFQPGDVMVLQPKSNGGGGAFGHVAMYTGQGNGRSGWFSDFDQNGPVSAYSKNLDSSAVSVLRYGVGYDGPKTGTPGHFWKKMANENIFNFSVDRRRGSESPESYINRNYEARKHRWAKWVTKDKLIDFYKKGRNWAANMVKRAVGTVENVVNGGNISPSAAAAENNEAVTGGEVFTESESESPDRTFKNFLYKASDTMKAAIHSLSHKVSEKSGWVMDKAGDGVDWEASLHGGTSYYPEPYKKSRAEKYMYAKYTGKDTAGYVIPSTISGGTTLNRDEWWAKFFDKDGNLKISKEDNVNPALMGKLEKIEIELKKGNQMSELDLKIAAHGLDAEMAHNAAETRDQKRLINALTVRDSERSMPMTGGD